jgi:hypothetical protein
VTRKAKINRRQFITGVFRGRDVALLEAGEDSALSGDVAPEKLGEHYPSGWVDEPQTGRDFTAPDTAPQIQDWDEGMNSVLEEMENTKGIEDF